MTDSSRDTAEVLNTRGTMATVNAQTSPTDATAGRGMLVGAFGVGSLDGNANVLTDQNVDLLVDQGKFYLQTPINTPVAGAAYIEIDVSDSTSYTKQTLRMALSDNIYGRSKIAGTWSAWQPVFTESNLNPNVFGGAAGGVVGVIGLAQNATTLLVPLPSSNKVKSPSITKGVGTYTIRSSTFNLHAGGIAPANVSYIAGNSSPSTALISVTTSGLSPGTAYYLIADSASSTIKAN